MTQVDGLRILLVFALAASLLLIFRARTGLYPELALFDKSERKATVRRAYGRVIREHRQYAFILLFIPIASSILGGMPGWIGLIVVACVCVVLLIHWERLRTRVRLELRKELREKGVQVCVPCGYSLTGNVSGVCPECGTEIGQP